MLRCFHYPRVGMRVQVLSPQRTSAFAAVVTAAPAEQLGVWGVRPLTPAANAPGEEQLVHFSRLASSWALPDGSGGSGSGGSGSSGSPGTRASVAAPPPAQPASLAAEAGDRDPRPLIAIVGAGLGGLAAAAAMQRWGARVEVYERDRSFDERKQGYGLTMQQGGAALRALGAEDLGSECVSGTLHVSFASDGTVLGRYGHDTRCSGAAEPAAEGDGSTSSGRPAAKRRKKSKRRNFLIPRQRLRQQLLDLLEPGTVRWGRSFESYDPLAPGQGAEGAGWTDEAGTHTLAETIDPPNQRNARLLPSSAPRTSCPQNHLSSNVTLALK